MTKEIKKRYIRRINRIAEELDAEEIQTLYRCAAALYGRKTIKERTRKDERHR